MATLTAEKTMLYCPKCQRKYEEGNQRFCNNDGGRLLPAVNAGVKRENETRGVFTNLLAKTSKRNEKDEQLSENPRFVKVEKREPIFEPPSKSSIFSAKKNLEPKLGKPKPQQPKKYIKTESVEIQTPIQKPIQAPTQKTTTPPTQKPFQALTQKTTTPPIQELTQPPQKTIFKEEIKSDVSEIKKTEKKTKPLSRLITPKNDINLGRAKLGDRKTNPTGRLALTKENPRVLLGQMVKGRYLVVEMLDKDQASIAYLAEDKIHKRKKVTLRVLMEKKTTDELQDKLISEERVSLSHVIHPNVAKVVDSGELPEGKSFIISEYVENESVNDFMDRTGVFNPLRTARIIRQSSMALNEVHQNGVLHRNLQPNHILLTVSETGNETAKVSGFSISDGKTNSENFKYKAPEQISGQLPTYASDSYSLAVIAYKMLTNSLPFEGETERAILKSQKVGLSTEVSSINSDVNPLVDSILRKALSFNPTERYSKARDFGEAFFNALTTVTPWDKEDEAKSKTEFKDELEKKTDKISIPTLPIGVTGNSKVKEGLGTPITQEKTNVDIDSDIHFDSTDNLAELDIATKDEVTIDNGLETEVKENSESSTLWKKRSPEPTREGNRLFTTLSIIGLILLVIGALATWKYFNGLEEQKPEIAFENSSPKVKDPTISVVDETNKASTPQSDPDIPPPVREITPPKDFQYFENSKQNLGEDLAKNFRGFSLYYPKTWEKGETKTNYVDVKLIDKAGYPKQQFLVTRYESKGRYIDDEVDFPALVAKSNKDLNDFFKDYSTVSQGEIKVNNGWRAYEVKFKGLVPKGKENVETWGRRIWIPSARPGVKNGFVITMLATSLSDKIDSLDDVGKTGDLGDILYTFKPDRNY